MWSQDIPEDVEQVLRTSAVLSISEFRVFDLAYASWYGREVDEETIEGHFMPYMFRDVVPPWVRSFTRKVLELERRGRLEPGELGIETPQAEAGDVSRGRFYAFVIAMSLIALYISANLAAPLLGIEDCWFPPCY
jgi:hypothetical protein